MTDTDTDTDTDVDADECALLEHWPGLPPNLSVTVIIATRTTWLVYRVAGDLSISTSTSSAPFKLNWGYIHARFSCSGWYRILRVGWRARSLSLASFHLAGRVGGPSSWQERLQLETILTQESQGGQAVYDYKLLDRPAQIPSSAPSHRTEANVFREMNDGESGSVHEIATASVTAVTTMVPH